MLAKVTLENFFSFGKPTSIALNQNINILVGINGSGKSNFIKAIQLLYEGVSGEGFEKIFIGQWSGFSHVANFSQSQKNYIKLTYEFDKDVLNKIATNKSAYHFKSNPIYEFTIKSSGATAYSLEENCFVGKSKDHFSFLEIKNGRGNISSRLNGQIIFEKVDEKSPFYASELILSQISDPFRYLPLFTLKQAIRNLSIYSCFDTTLTSKIREAKGSVFENKLFYNGDNLTPLLQKLQINYPIEYEKIESQINKINPFFKNILFNPFGSKYISMLRETQLARTVSIEHISDGTLQFLLLLSIFYNPDRGTLVCVDEPEKGLHPDMTRTIAKAIQSVNNSQCIIATHSPLLLNAFSLGDVFIFEKDEGNQTVVSQKKEEEFEGIYENILVGQLWLNGELGGKRW